MIVKSEVAALLKMLYKDEFLKSVQRGADGEALDGEFLQREVASGACLVKFIEMTMKRNKKSLKYVFIDFETLRSLSQAKAVDRVKMTHCAIEAIKVLCNIEFEVNLSQTAAENEATVISVLNSLVEQLKLDPIAMTTNKEHEMSASIMTDAQSKSRAPSHQPSLQPTAKTHNDNTSVSNLTKNADLKSALNLIVQSMCFTMQMTRKAVILLGFGNAGGIRKGLVSDDQKGQQSRGFC